MFFRLKSATVIGVDASIIDIEVDLKKGLPHQSIVGLPDPAIREARERVISATRNSGFLFPLGSLTVNLAPADLRKEGSIFDLAIAIGILVVSGQFMIHQDIDSLLIVGELSLDGYVRPIHGLLAILEKAQDLEMKAVILPYENHREASLISGLTFYPVKYLKDAVSILSGNVHKQVDESSFEADHKNPKLVIKYPKEKREEYEADFSEIKGQCYVKRAVEIAAAGGHNILLIGSPGSGKSMVASRIPTILPDLSEKEAIETTKIYSIAGLLPPEIGLMKRKPFRTPHPTASEISIIGGGRNPIPGEITLAHNGVLFLDEFPEFKNSIIQSLRQPIEEGVIQISRADTRIVFPALFMLVAAMNPCPCGYLFDPERTCKCTPVQINKYYMKVSGPILDRIDIQVAVRPLEATEIIESRAQESSSAVKDRVETARRLQQKRFSKRDRTLNARMSVELIKKYCILDKQTQEILYTSVKKYRLSARSYYKILKVARTVADLDQREKLIKEDVLEALSYREVESILYNTPSAKVPSKKSNFTLLRR